MGPERYGNRTVNPDVVGSIPIIGAIFLSTIKEVSEMRSLIIGLIMFMFSVPAFATSWDEGYYFGFSRGTASLNYDVEGALDDYIDDSGYRLYVDVLEAVGYPIVLDTDFTSQTTKFILGKELNKYWGLELIYENLGKYTAGAGLEINKRAEWNESYVEAGAFAKANARMYVSALSASFLGKIPLYRDKVFLYNRLGAAYLSARVSTTLQYGYNYAYDTGYEDYRGGDGVVYTQKKSYNKNAIVPYVGVGFGINVMDEFTVRVEYSRYGDFRNDANISSTVVEMLYNF